MVQIKASGSKMASRGGRGGGGARAGRDCLFFIVQYREKYLK